MGTLLQTFGTSVSVIAIIAGLSSAPVKAYEPHHITDATTSGIIPRHDRYSTIPDRETADNILDKHFKKMVDEIFAINSIEDVKDAVMGSGRLNFVGKGVVSVLPDGLFTTITRDKMLERFTKNKDYLLDRAAQYTEINVNYSEHVYMATDILALEVKDAIEGTIVNNGANNLKLPDNASNLQATYEELYPDKKPDWRDITSRNDSGFQR